MKKAKAVYQIVTPVRTGKTKSSLQSEITPQEKTEIYRALVSDIELKTQLEGSRGKVFLDRYSLKDLQGSPSEQYVEQMWQRVAGGIAMMEKTDALKKEWAQKFYEAMQDFKFVPAGRILSGAGTGYEVTFFNCYVIPSPKDSRGGIMENITHTVEIQARGGGVGINLSSLRPSGARVRKVNGTSSGPVSWAKLYSAANHDVIQQGGSRRGALMLMLHDWHPDVLQFIHAKEDGKSIPGANLSVCISDSFMEAVKNDENWVTRFPDTSDPDYDAHWDGDIEKWEKSGRGVKVYETLKAKDIWDQICTSAWASAEPGLHFLERSNKWGNTWYFEKLLSTNPCVTGDTLVATSQGWRRADEIKVGDSIGTVLGQGQVDDVEVHEKAEVYAVKFSDGAELKATQAHQFHAIKTGNRAKNSANKHFSEISLSDLKVGDVIRVAPSPMPDNAVEDLPDGWKERDYGFFVGMLLGDGCITPTSLSRNVVKMAVNSDETEWNRIVGQVMQKTTTGTISLDQSMGSKSANFVSQSSMGAALMVRNSLLTPGYSYEKFIPLRYQNSNREFLSGLLDGLYSTDGNVNLTTSHPQLRFKTTSKKLAQDIRRILLNFNIHGHIATIKKVADSEINGRKIISKHQQYEILISGAGMKNFAQQIGLSHPDKQAKLIRALKEFALTGNTWLTQIKSIEYAGIEKVYDLHEPVSDTWITEGVVSRGCGEQPLGEWAVCNLGAMNLSAFVNADGQFDYENLDKNVRVAMRFMDNVVDANYYFFEENEKKAKEIRRTGIGTMGLADALIKMKLQYGSEEAQPVIEKIYQIIRDASYEVSSDLAKEKGSFPKFDKTKYLQGYFIKQLPEGIKQKIAKQGIRNAVILTQAPTGTTSILAGVSSGIEPVFDFQFIRKDRIGTQTIYHPLFEAWKKENPEVSERPSYFVNANDLSPMDHVRVQALIQRYTDSSISKTANAPFEFTVEQVKELYMSAYDLGCKGVTFFRDGSRSAVLYREEEKKEEPKVDHNASVSQDTVVSRPMILRGRTYKVQTPVGEAFVTINRDEQDLPFEVFVTVGRGGMHTMADAEAMGRLISLSLRLARGGRNVTPADVANKIVSQLRGIGGASHVGFGKDRVMSLADAIAKVLAEDIALGGEQKETIPLALEQSTSAEESNSSTNGKIETSSGTVEQLTVASGLVDDVAPGVPTVLQMSPSKQADLCPECGAATFVMEEGCSKCYSCGYSKC